MQASGLMNAENGSESDRASADGPILEGARLSRDIHERLILGRLDDELKQWLERLESAEPGLSCLSPLARASYHLLSRGSVSREEAAAALAATFLIASEDAEGLLDASSCICTFEQEKVAHVIPIQVTSTAGSRQIDLMFTSSGDLQCMLGGDAPLTPFLSLSTLRLNPGSSDALTEDWIFSAYESIGRHHSPVCYPCDTDFIGILTYTLTEVGGHQVCGPCLCDQKNYFEWLDLGLLAEEPDQSEFCWLHQLTQSQAEALDLTCDTGSHRDPGLPSWLSEDVQCSPLWINRDDLYESYAKGAVIGYEVSSLLLCLGAGEAWTPGDLELWMNEDDPEADTPGGVLTDPSRQAPIKVYALSKGLACEDLDIQAVFRLLVRLFCAAC